MALRRIIIVLMAVSAVYGTAACGTLEIGIETTATPNETPALASATAPPTETTTPLATDTPEPAPTDTAQPAPTATPTATTAPAPPTNTPVPPPPTQPPSTPSATPTPLPDAAPTTWSGLATWLEDTRAAGTDEDAVHAELRAAGWQDDTSSWLSIDLNADGQVEWLMSLYDPNEVERPWGNPGDFWVLNDSGIVYRFSDRNDADYWTAPALLGQTDMTGDGRLDVIIDAQGCGAHTCYSNYIVLSSHRGAVENVVDASAHNDESLAAGIQMAYDTVRFGDMTGDGLDDLVLTGGIIGSAGAGIQRARTEVWSWTGNAVSLVDTEWEETDYRFHVLYNANAAFDDGDIERARTLYTRVIDDETLTDTEGFEVQQSTYDASRQFAAFRLALLALQSGDFATADAWREWLAENYSNAPITAGAEKLIAEWKTRQDLAAACTEVTRLLASADAPTGPLGYMGYNNPELTAEDVCPVRENSGSS